MSIKTAMLDGPQRHVFENSLPNFCDLEFVHGKFALTINCLSSIEVVRIAEAIREALEVPRG